MYGDVGKIYDTFKAILRIADKYSTWRIIYDGYGINRHILLFHQIVHCFSNALLIQNIIACRIFQFADMDTVDSVVLDLKRISLQPELFVRFSENIKDTMQRSHRFISTMPERQLDSRVFKLIGTYYLQDIFISSLDSKCYCRNKSW